MQSTHVKSTQEIPSHPIILYDGVCGLCNRLNRFVLKRDREDRFRFASLQSEVANLILNRHGVSASDLDTVYVALNVEQTEERLLARSEAIIFVFSALGGFWSFAATVFRAVPRFLRDRLYNLVAHNRYRVFGKYDVCLMPDAKYAAKFLDASDTRRA